MNSELPSTPTIFVVTCMQLRNDPEEPWVVYIKSRRAWGWHPSLARATQAVMFNEMDIYESGSYNGVVIEEIPCGTLEIPIAEHWFAVDYDPARENPYDVIPVAKPTGLQHVVGFAW
jgi:hypothetical protein